MFDKKEYAQRRAAFFQKLPDASIAILKGAEEQTRNGDAEYAFRQNSDFYYLTGYPEPEAIAIFLKNQSSCQYILFNREKHPEMERWTGPRVGQEDACRIYQAEEAFPISTFVQKLPDFLAGKERLYFSIGKNADWDKEIIAAVQQLTKKTRTGVKFPTEFISVETIIHEMRLKKTPYEIALMRKAAQISAKAHLTAMQRVKPGIKEYELEAELLYEFTRQGARAVAYNTIVGGGARGCVLHYVANNEVLEDNELVLIDAGAEYHNYASDITRTFPVNGKFTAEQLALYKIVLQAQLAVIELVKPGCPWNKLQEKAVEVISAGLIELGLMQGKLSDVIAKQTYRNFYMHTIGHWLGLDVHDVGLYKINDAWRELEPGMVLTVEPGIYISDDAKVANKWQNIGIRIEDDVLVTDHGCEILSKDVPKNPEDIMNCMQ